MTILKTLILLLEFKVLNESATVPDTAYDGGAEVTMLAWKSTLVCHQIIVTSKSNTDTTLTDGLYTNALPYIPAGL